MSTNCDHIDSLVLIAGLSGAGRTTAINTFSDEGYFIVDNLPVPLFGQFIEHTSKTPSKYSKTALLMSIVDKQEVADLLAVIKKLNPDKTKFTIVFLDASSQTLIKRYGETRRPHPIFNPDSDETLLTAVERERSFLTPIKEKANLIIDTTSLNVHDLRRDIKAFVDSTAPGQLVKLRVNFVSFGFKYGVPNDCDLLLDVRFIKNPYFEDTLRKKTGLEKPVQDFVLAQDEAKTFVEKTSDLLNFLLPCYVHEGKAYINIGIGCTGGRHRSVTLVEHLSQALTGEDWLVSKSHRDVEL